ncbi:MAG TPA: hypothetical protein VNQ74_10245, partial [Burkholderiaceae bacterium]|nr:hypothetical protein [Burkholderiaceae bacterium]
SDTVRGLTSEAEIDPKLLQQSATNERTDNQSTCTEGARATHEPACQPARNNADSDLSSERALV